MRKLPSDTQTERISEIWTRGLEGKLKDDFIQALKHDTLVLGRLDEIIDIWLAELAHSEGSHSDYDNPSWAYKTADRIGRRRTLLGIKELIAPALRKQK